MLNKISEDLKIKGEEKAQITKMIEWLKKKLIPPCYEAEAEEFVSKEHHKDIYIKKHVGNGRPNANTFNQRLY